MYEFFYRKILFILTRIIDRRTLGLSQTVKDIANMIREKKPKMGIEGD